MFFEKLFKKSDHAENIQQIFDAIVKQARNKIFYAELGIPDTLEGRFEMITLHMFLIVEYLKNLELQHESAKTKILSQVSQELMEHFFSELDGTLREMGVGDITVPKKMRKLADSFYGRLYAYSEAISKKDADMMLDALDRNIYSHLEEKPALEQMKQNLKRLTDYVMKSHNSIKRGDYDEMKLGKIPFASDI